jgi:DNA polymerase III subunit delta'
MISLPGVGSVWDGVVGQPAAVAALQHAGAAPVHAYLLVGPTGSTKEQAARAFAAMLLAGEDDPASRDARLVLGGRHPDVHEIERAGPFISSDQAREIVRVAALAPVEGDRKVMILHEFHLLRPEGAAVLLKTIEEPPPSTIFLVLADFVPADLVTVASRCVRVDFRAVPDDVLAARLVAEGTDPDTAAHVAVAAGGDLSRARLLAVDPALDERRRAFGEVPTRLDGTGATVMRVVDELLGRIEEAAAPLAARHADELAELERRVEMSGERGGGRKVMDERHKRELRRHRTDELRRGLAVLAGSYRDRLAAGHAQRPEALVTAVARIHQAIDALERNPNESLLLQSLLWSLPADAGHGDGLVD